jgi:two-component system sensor histidine kinase YesM
MKECMMNCVFSSILISIVIYAGMLLSTTLLVISVIDGHNLSLVISLLLLLIFVMLELLQVIPSRHIFKYCTCTNDAEKHKMEIRYPEITRVIRYLAEQVVDDVNRKSLEQLNEIANIKLLQSQISPHFLYNTLDSIRGELFIRKMYDLSDTLEALSSIYRFKIDQKKMLIPFAEELANTEKYVQIMRFRFTNRFQFLKYFDETDEVIMNYTMPKLILQPIVENAIHHGLETKIGTGLITLSVHYTDLSMVMSIADNGSGIDSHTLEALNLSLANQEEPETTDAPKKNRNGIALYNINERIHLLYGKQFGISVASSPNCGTQVQMILPRSPVISYGENNNE